MDEDKEASKADRSIIEKQPNLRFAYIVIHYPCRVIGVFGLILICVMIADIFGFKFDDGQSSHTYFIKGEPEVDKMDAITLAQRGIAEAIDIQTAVQTQSIEDFALVIMFKTKDNSNLLNVDNLKFISDMTMKISETDVNKYNKLCLKSESDGSWPDCSIGSIWDPLVTWYNDNNGNVTQTELDTWLNDINTDDDSKESYWNCFEEGFSNSLSSKYYRGFWSFGLPYPDIDITTSSYINKDDQFDKQAQHYNDYIDPIYQDMQLKTHNDNIEIVIFGFQVRNLQMNRLVSAGVSFSVFSIITVILLMWLHLRSLFLAIASIFQIIIGFPFAFFVYRWIAQITYFDTMSTLVIFLILGIGADDVFVFVDAWRQSVTLVGDDIVDRMSFTYRRASKAMIITTGTTFFAFIATGLSPIIPISAFGFWAACVVLMNYVMVITLFPAILSLWYQYIKDKERCCCKKNKDLDSKEDNDEDGRANVTDADMLYRTEDSVVQELLTSNAHCVERFFRDKWFWFISKAKWVLIVVSLILIGLSSWKTSEMSPLSKQEEFFPADHYMEKQLTWQSKFYAGAATEKTQLRMVWGLEKDLDKTDMVYWDVDSWGNVKYDTNFDISPIVAQEHILYVCDNLLNDLREELYETDDYFKCFMHDFKDYGESYNLTFPFVFSDQKREYLDLFEEWLTQDSIGKTYVANGLVGYIETTNELRFVLIDTKIQSNGFDSFENKQKDLDRWEARMNEYNNIAVQNGANTVSKGFQASTFSWGWIATDRGFVRSAVQGIGIALPLAFLSLLISTQNVIVSIFAILAIVGIVVSEVALMVLQGWELGISESIAIVMMIGFSVDYVVHLGNSYIECEISGQRDIRTIWALYTMAISVVFGALTTFGSGFWLIWPEMMFFKKFGFLIMTVVALSLYYSLVFFMSLLAALGPKDKQGYCPIWKCINPCCNYCSRACESCKLNLCAPINKENIKLQDQSGVELQLKEKSKNDENNDA